MKTEVRESGLVVPSERFPDLLREYRRLHSVCPECGSVDLETTCVGFIPLSPSAQDTNQAKCVCGWQGIVHDLVEGGNDQQSG